MRDYLLFQLYAPLTAWGDQAVGQERPSADHPSRSALLGMMAAALGLDRYDDEAHAVLAQSCRFGMKVYNPGLALRDFHTAQTPPEDRKVHHLFTRRDELSGEKLGTILSFRSYRQDSLSVVALWLEGDRYQLRELCEALLQPRYQLYLGRKSCAPALPLNPCILPADSLNEALDIYPVDRDLQNLRKPEIRYYWEPCEHSGMRESWRTPRYDEPLSRLRWQFTSRDEFVSLAKEDT